MFRLVFIKTTLPACFKAYYLHAPKIWYQLSETPCAFNSRTVEINVGRKLARIGCFGPGTRAGPRD